VRPSSIFYPWDTEPTAAINDPKRGATILYETFRNPMAHALGFQDPEPPEAIRITRFPGEGLNDQDLEAIETSVQRPSAVLGGAPTLRTNDGAIELNAESFYWGAREMVRRLTADSARMARADAFLRPLLRSVTPRR
jgi:hypothetical protein